MKLFTKKTICDLDGDPYLTRYCIFQCKWFSIKLHKIHKPDWDRYLHDHPWWFMSIILRGWYNEQTNSGTKKVGWFNFKKPKTMHRIADVSKNLWTLVITGPKIREWGFNTEEGWKPWYECNYGTIII